VVCGGAMRRIALASLAVAVAGSQALADPLADCSRGRNAEVRLRACSEVIASSAFGPDDKAVAYRNRGNARADAGAATEAIADFSETIKLRPNDAASHAGRGRARLTLNDISGAIADYSEALRLTPDSASFLVGRGHARFIKGDLPDAIADFTDAIRLNPKSASAFNRRGLAYRRSGDLARALDDYSKAITLNPAYALAYNNRGYVYEAQGRKEEAIADLQLALLLDPSLVGARHGLARLGIPAAWLAATDARIKAGKEIVEQNCSSCHAVSAAGASPNKKAPEFRNLHARHPNLALREPLARGIAAPHDEMPKFVLSGPQIDTIIAYINSLSVKGSALRAKSAMLTDAMDIADARKGLSYAQKVCAVCHNVSESSAPSPNSQAPPFKLVANLPGASLAGLTEWSRAPHSSMPNLIVEPNDIDDVIAYILTLKDRK
jgi:tetratricopeptide (TPR) repeat protein